MKVSVAGKLTNKLSFGTIYLSHLLLPTAESAEVVGSEIENTNLSPSHLATSLSTPPAKRATPAKASFVMGLTDMYDCVTVVCVQDEEMGRREALERKLDEERVRGKKKKKRLM